jgi:hypothetical protein
LRDISVADIATSIRMHVFSFLFLLLLLLLLRSDLQINVNDTNNTEETFVIGDFAKEDFILVKVTGKSSISYYTLK